jgi:hypothetical protein
MKLNFDYDWNLLENMMVDHQVKYKKGINKGEITEELKDSLNRYVALKLNSYNFPLWFSLERKVLIARIMRNITEQLPFMDIEINDKKTYVLIDDIITKTVVSNIREQKKFSIKLDINGKIIDMQETPRVPLKDEVIVYKGVDYLIEVVKWDVTNGNIILKTKN